MRVLVAGGTGFIGGAILRALAEAGGFDPVAAARHGVESGGFRRCDATDPDSVARAAEGAGAIVNATMGSPRGLVAAARVLSNAAARAGARYVEIGSMAAYGPATGCVSETAPLLARSAYGIAKRGAEQAARSSGADVTILRAGIVVGAGSHAWVARIARLLRSGRLGDLGAGGDGICNLVCAADLGRAVALLLARPSGPGAIYNVGAPDPPDWNGYFAALAVALGTGPLRRIGAARLALEARAAPLLQILGRLPGSPAPDAIPASLQALFRQRIELDCRAIAGLGLVSAGAGRCIAESAAWVAGGT